MSQTPSEHRKERLRSSLARLAAEPEAVTRTKVWRALTAEERERAALAVLEDAPPPDRDELIRETAKLHHFRLKTVEDWPNPRIAKAVARRAPTKGAIVTGLLQHFHLSARRKLLADFLDGLGIGHEKGSITEEVDAIDVAPADVKHAADRLLPLHPIDEVVTYFLSLIAIRYSFANGLEEWLRDLVGSTSAETHDDDDLPADDLPADEVKADPLGPEPVAAEDTDEFTTLDRQLVRTIVDVAQGIEGALTVDELDDLLQEILELNSTRHRTYFHAGFRDAVLDAEPRDGLRASNETRRRWYWAGFVQGLVREGRWREVVEHFDREQAVRDLGTIRHGAVDKASAAASARAAAPHITEALCRHGRAGEAAKFIDVGVIVTAPGAFHLLRSEAEALLRQDNAAEARTVYDLLANVVERLTQQGLATGQRAFLEVRRRRAHCYRQLGELNVARSLLTELLEKEPDAEIRAMVLTDLGLIDGGFRRLADLSVPLDEERLDGFAAALERGVPRFEDAMALDVRYSAHARYCLGVLAFVRKLYGKAIDHLEVALSVFESEPDRYGPGSVLPHARLYLGLALCLEVRTGRMRRAAELIRDSIASGAQLPPYLISNALDALALSSKPAARETGEIILEAMGDEALDLLVASEACRDSDRVAQALFDRASDARRPEGARVQDFRKAIPILIGHEHFDRAAEALDFLENAAFRGLGREEFIEILDDPDRYSPAWDVEDAEWALARCFEVAGHYADAARVLTKQFHRILSQNGADGITEAEAIIGRIREYGLSEDHCTPLQRRLEAIVEESSDQASPPQVTERQRIRILFVGGDERQAQYDAAIEEELQKQYPHITVEFCHPGWGSQWGRTLEDVKRRLAHHDGVVVSRYLRTEFGRQLRKSLEVPWRGCYGTGKQAMVNSIIQAARSAEGTLGRKDG